MAFLRKKETASDAINAERDHLRTTMNTQAVRLPESQQETFRNKFVGGGAFTSMVELARM